MGRTVCYLGLIALLLCPKSASADTGGRTSASPPRASSTTKRVIWTLVGIGAGFGAGVFIGLNAFDDSINSDRKVWTSAIGGAVAGGLAGGLISRNIAREPRATPAGPSSKTDGLPLARWPSSSFLLMPDDDDLRQRVREINHTSRPVGPCSLLERSWRPAPAGPACERP